MNIKLDVISNRMSSVTVRKKGYDFFKDGIDDDYSIDYPRLMFKDKVLVECDYEEPDDFMLTLALEDGIDYQMGRFAGILPVKYDIDAWNLTDLTVGEVILEVYKRGMSYNFVKDWVEYVQYLAKVGGD